jgi:Photosynthetic reaction centre cytochrome C subunit
VHAAPAGRGGPLPFNFASDDKPQKKAAREMMLMVRDINPKVAAAVGKSAEAATRVGCVTCHRGVAIPKQLADILDQTAMEKGTQAAVAQYKDLRKQYFGAQAYDFSEGSLTLPSPPRTTPQLRSRAWKRRSSSTRRMHS